MRLGTFEWEGQETCGVVVPNPATGEDWIFAPAAVERLAGSLPALKGGGYAWARPRFGLETAWPRELSGLLGLGTPGLDAARRLQEFVQGYWQQGDPFLLAAAGSRVSRARLQAPVPEPRLLLGLVGNNAGFMRLDPARGRNLHQPAVHERTRTSLVGPGQPIVLPPGTERWAGTTELGVIIGRGGRAIAREKARDHIAGYTVINDGLGSLYAQRWAQLDGGRLAPGHFHTANTASWLDKKSDTMLAMGPWLTTPDEVGDPYDLLCYYREGGHTRNRAHSGALVCGIEECIAWLSRFLTLEPGMVIHLGAMGQDGLPAGKPENFGPDYFVESEIERIGTLRNPLVAPAHHDWRAADEPGRAVHPSPAVRRALAAAPAQASRPADWQPAQARHFWTLLANHREAQAQEKIEPRAYPLAYHAPITSLARSGETRRLPPTHGTLTASVELGFVIKSITARVTPAKAGEHILGFVALIVLRDSLFRDGLVQPHLLSAGMPVVYARWPDGFNVAGSCGSLETDWRGRAMSVAVDGFGTASANTDGYLLDPTLIVSELSLGITLLPGDVIALGWPGVSVEIPASANLSAGLRVHAEIAGLPPVTATFSTP